MQLLLKNPDNYLKKVDNTKLAKKVFNWQNEEKVLHEIFRKLMKEVECQKGK